MEFFDKAKQRDFSPVGKLRLIQTVFMERSRCDVKGCWSGGRAMHADNERKAFIVCLKHQTEGVESGLLKPIPVNDDPLGKPGPTYFGE